MGDKLGGLAAAAQSGDSTKIGQAGKAFVEELNRNLDFHEKRMKRKNWSHVAGNELTIADFVIANYWYTFCAEGQSANLREPCKASFKKYEDLLKSAKKLKNDKLEKYLDSRQYLPEKRE